MLNIVKSAFGGKKILIGLAVLSLVLGVAVPVWATDTETVSCTVTPKLIALTVEDGSVDYGPLDLNSEKSTKDLGDNQTVTNTGNVNEEIEVKTSDAIGGTTWTAASTAGSDQFVHFWSANPGDGSPIWTAWSVADTYATLVASLTSSGTQLLGLKIHTPTAITDHEQKSITVTVLATEATP